MVKWLSTAILSGVLAAGMVGCDKPEDPKPKPAVEKNDCEKCKDKEKCECEKPAEKPAEQPAERPAET